MNRTDSLTIRRVDAHDAPALWRLAALDGTSIPAGALLVAEVDGEPWAAVEVSTGAAVADPFRPTADVVELLRFHARGAHRPRRARPLWPRLRARAA